MTGKTVGRWTVIGPAASPDSGRRGVHWLCRCECGSEKVVRGWALRHSNSFSCGCERGVKHGYARDGKTDRLYVIWQDMKARCNYPKNIGYGLYGGRGITVCAEWMDFIVFADWAKTNGYESNLTLDRIDGNKGYFPENCRWITNREQQRNKRNNVFVDVDGERHCLAEWAEVLDIPKTRIYKARQRGKDLEVFIRKEKMEKYNG